MKKKLALLLATVMTAAAFGNVYADTASVKLQLNGKALESDQPPVIDNGRTMVPVRVVAEALGCDVDWNAETKTASFTRSGITAKLTIGEDILTITAGSKVQEIKIDTPAQIMNSRTMVPIRFLSESFGCKVEWDADTKTVNVISKLIEDALTSPSAVEVAATPSVSEVKEAAEKLDESIGEINKYVDKLSDKDKESFDKICYTVATVLKNLSFTDVSDDVLKASMKATEEAGKKLSNLIEKYNFSDEDDSPVATEKTAAEKLDAGIGVVNKYVDKLSDEDKEYFDKICYTVATVLKSLSFANVSDEILEQAEGATEEVEEKLAAMAAKYDFAKEYAEAVK